MNVDFLTTDMVWSYAEACITVHDKIEALREDGYDLLVVPSRGASPFISGAHSHSFQVRAEKYEPSAPYTVYQPISELYLPFTADVSDDHEIEPSTIRSYWARVLSSIIKGNYKDPALLFYDTIFNQAEKLTDSYARNLKGRKIIFIDTVISGRAICEIIDAIDREGIHDCHYILLIDEKGEKLKAKYRGTLEAAALARKATLIYVEKIFTEDEGPAVSGIWTVTVPALMVAAQKMIPEFQEANITGAGLYYIEVARRPDNSNLAITVSNAKLSTLIHSVSTVTTTKELLEHNLEQFKKHVGDNSLQDQKITKQIAESIIFEKLRFINDVDVSGSHVLRGHLSNYEAEKIVKEFLESQKIIT